MKENEVSNVNKDVALMNFLNEPQSYVTILPNGEIHVTVDSVLEVKLALKELKLKKKEYSFAKRNVMQQQRAIRASYTRNLGDRAGKIWSNNCLQRSSRSAGSRINLRPAILTDSAICSWIAGFRSKSRRSRRLNLWK